MRQFRLFICFVASLICLFNVFAQNRTVSGTVIDQYDRPVVGATVVEDGTQHAVISDNDGNFTLIVSKLPAKLNVTMLGMHSATIDADGTKAVSVKLQDDVIGLEEVVAIGYGSVRKEEV